MSALLVGESSVSRMRPILTLVVGLALFASTTSCNRGGTNTAGKSGEGGNVAPKTFDSPAAAGAALFEAAKAGDQNALVEIFGSEGKDFVYSGDSVKDKNAMQTFVDKYSRMNRWDARKSGDEILYIGADNFAFPIPLSKNSSGKWAFNTAAGKDEVLARRIGDGELTTIGVLTEVANAQQEYFSQNHQFAQKFISDGGQRNGLYWPVSAGQHSSPLGGLVDVAKALGYSQSDKPQPFNGYYYKILTRQGDAAKGGAKDYIAGGKMTGGFAVIAWPAKYRDSGIMTFLVGKDGMVYQKDLGEKTTETAAAITDYNPGDGWTVILAPESPSKATRDMRTAQE